MIEMYYNLVINGRRTCDEGNPDVPLVPASIRKDVLALLTERGYDANGKPIEVAE